VSTTLPAHFTMRPAKIDDVEAVTTLLNACAIEQVGRAQVEADAIRNRWQSPDFNLETDSRVVVAPDGEFVGHGRVWDVQPHVRIYGGGHVHPEYKGRGIGTALCQWVEERARQAIPKAAEGARVVLLQNTLSTDSASSTGAANARWASALMRRASLAPPAFTRRPGCTCSVSTPTMRRNCALERN
jgi:predicted N-acetyltransferase YhbS